MQHTRPWLRATLLVAICSAPLADALPAVASCAPGPGVERLLSGTKPDYDAIFIGTATSVGDAIKIEGTVLTPTTFDVEARLRGPVGSSATVLSSFGTTGNGESVSGGEEFHFTEGDRYVVVADSRPDGAFTASSCTPTHRVSDAEAQALIAKVQKHSPIATPSWSPAAGRAVSADAFEPPDTTGVQVVALLGIFAAFGIAGYRFWVRRRARRLR